MHAGATFEYAMKVERIWEAPRVTKPYSEAQWSAIDALGQQIDDACSADDVRLTMGGEPTFVSSEEARGAGVEHRGARREQTQDRGRAVPAVSRNAMRPWACAFRPGEVVSRRTAAALVIELLLAQRRRTDLERCHSHRARSPNAIPRPAQTRRGCSQAVAERLGVSRRACVSGV